MSPIAVLNDCDDPLRCIGLPPTASAGNARSSCASVDPVPIGDPDEDEGCDDDEDEDEDEDETTRSRSSAPVVAGPAWCNDNGAPVLYSVESLMPI